MWLTQLHKKLLNAMGNLNGAIDVNRLERTSTPLDLYFSKALAPATAVAAALPDPSLGAVYDVLVDDATNFQAGTYTGIFSTTAVRFYFAEVLSVTSNTLTMDTPFDYEFAIGDVVIPLTRDLNVDGSTTPEVFSIQAPMGGLTVDLTRFMLSMTHASAGDDGKFGGILALSRGLVLRRVDGDVRNYWNVKTNGELANLAYDVAYPARSGGQGDYGTRCRYTWDGDDKHGVIIRLETGDSIDLIIQDNLTALDSARALIAGREKFN